MTRLDEFLSQQGFVVLDGGFATELEARGADLNDSLWSAKLLLDAPQMLEDVNYEYLRAGADVAVSASYQATIPGLMGHGLTAPQAEARIRKSVAIARQACDRFWTEPGAQAGRLKPLIVASIGPYGAYLHDGSEYLGHYGLTRNQLKDFHRARLAILVDCAPDLIAFESFPSQLEAEAIVELMDEFAEARCWLSFTCRSEGLISEGTPFREAVRAVAGSSQVVAVGLNCTAPSDVEALLLEAKQVTDKPLVAYPNSGECFDAGTGTWGKTSELGVIQEAAVKWYAAGARLIGGCCRTTPATIRSIRAALWAHQHQPV
jgi:homocysteine S-methyltransferase